MLFACSTRTHGIIVHCDVQWWHPDSCPCCSRIQQQTKSWHLQRVRSSRHALRSHIYLWSNPIRQFCFPQRQQHTTGRCKQETSYQNYYEPLHYFSASVFRKKIAFTASKINQKKNIKVFDLSVTSFVAKCSSSYLNCVIIFNLTSVFSACKHP